MLLDLRPDAIIADFFVIANGTSDRQLGALMQDLREAGKAKASRLPLSTEGEPASGWVLLDYGDVIVHLFLNEQRRYYDLEGFWKQANVLLSIQ